MDIIEATYLRPSPTIIVDTDDLIIMQSNTLQKREEDLESIHNKVFDHWNEATKKFEPVHAITIFDYDFTAGDLVLIWNTVIEKLLNLKMWLQYIGPLVVISQNRGGAYIIAEFNGTVFDRPVAQFHVIPYLAQKLLPLTFNVLDIPIGLIQDMYLQALPA